MAVCKINVSHRLQRYLDEGAAVRPTFVNKLCSTGMRSFIVILFSIISAAAFCQNQIAADSNQHPNLVDSATFRVFPLQNFYGKPVKDFLKEVKNKGFTITECLTLYSGKFKTIGVSVYFGGEEDFLDVFFEQPISNWSSKDSDSQPCDNMKINKSIIGYFRIHHTNTGRMIWVQPRSKWPKNN
jgi:hypothetical protein